MNSDKKDRSGSAKATPVAKKDIELPSKTKLPNARAPVKGKDIARLVLDLMWSEDKEGNDG